MSSGSAQKEHKKRRLGDEDTNSRILALEGENTQLAQTLAGLRRKVSYEEGGHRREKETLTARIEALIDTLRQVPGLESENTRLVQTLAELRQKDTEQTNAHQKEREALNLRIEALTDTLRHMPRIQEMEEGLRREVATLKIENADLAGTLDLLSTRINDDPLDVGKRFNRQWWAITP